MSEKDFEMILEVGQNGSAAPAPAGKHAWTVKVGEKGQIVIPKEARELMDIRPGDTLLLLGDDEQGLAIPRKTVFAQITETVFGRLKGSDGK